MKKENVTHKGIIKSVTPGSLTIVTDDDCRCDGCAVVALCNKGGEGDQREMITIDTPEAQAFSPGERVEVTASSASTLRATWWALILPTVIFVATLLGVSLGWPESGAWSIGAAFAALAVYDAILWLCRKSLAQKLHWTVRRLD